MNTQRLCIVLLLLSGSTVTLSTFKETKNGITINLVDCSCDQAAPLLTASNTSITAALLLKADIKPLRLMVTNESDDAIVLSRQSLFLSLMNSTQVLHRLKSSENLIPFFKGTALGALIGAGVGLWQWQKVKDLKVLKGSVGSVTVHSRAPDGQYHLDKKESWDDRKPVDALWDEKLMATNTHLVFVAPLFSWIFSTAWYQYQARTLNKALEEFIKIHVLDVHSFILMPGEKKEVILLVDKNNVLPQVISMKFHTTQGELAASFDLRKI